MSNNNDLEILINDFLNYSDELKETKIFGFEICFVDDIFQAIYDIDKEYAGFYSDSLKCACGLLYPAVDGEIFLYVKKELGMTTYETVLHEIIHLHDYIQYADYLNEKDIRKLTEDDVFKYWTEFHAEYLTYLYLINKNGLSCTPAEFCNQLRNRFDILQGQGKIELCKELDISVRNFGRYIALKEIYDEMPVYPSSFFYNRDFLNIYKFLYSYRSFDLVKERLKKFEELLLKTET